MRIGFEVDTKRWLKGTRRQRKKINQTKILASHTLAYTIAKRARSIAASKIKYKSTGQLISGIYAIPDTRGATVVSTSEHSRFFEYGTGIHYTKGSGRKKPWLYKHRSLGFVFTRGQKAKPFFEPAITSTVMASSGIFKRIWR